MSSTTTPTPAIQEAIVEPQDLGHRWVWLIPIATILVIGWFFYQNWREQGPEIQVSFVDGAGLDPGLTPVRFKDVQVGKVTSVSLSDNLSKVETTISLSRSMADHLGPHTQFWIVRPRVSFQGISGLDTLISGSYIAMDPGMIPEDAEIPAHYVGLESPPVVTSDALGSRFLLKSPSLGEIDVTTPVYYREIPVGEVVRYQLDNSGSAVDIEIFIRAPYNRLVQNHSRFWNISGIAFKFDGQAVAQIGTLSTLVAGGIAFDTPLRLNDTEPASPDREFRLFESLEDAEQPELFDRIYYRLMFAGSLRGLRVNAPVEFRGLRVGTVLDVQMEIDPDTLDIQVPVLIALEPARIGISGEGNHIEPEGLLRGLVERGMRAQLASDSLLTGSMFVDLVVFDDLEPGQIVETLPYPTFPTASAELEEFTNAITDILDQVSRMPLVEISEELLATIQSINGVTSSPKIDQSLTALADTLRTVERASRQIASDLGPITQGLDATIAQAQKTLREIEIATRNSENWLGQKSPILQRATRLVDELSATARSFRSLAEFLQRNPSSVLYGKGLFRE